ncbi:MAG: DUF488 family protein [Chloroflexota bacterium]
MTIKLVTIGVYGYDDERFFRDLQDANVDTFCDVRWRRGVRGAKYAFANSKRLQARLDELGIRYLHRRDLAPPPDVRKRQAEADKSSKTPRRQRTELGDAFKGAYREQVLADFDPQSLLDDLPPDARIVALFCVEGQPAACHRSLLAQTLHDQLDLEVEHLVPE